MYLLHEMRVNCPFKTDLFVIICSFNLMLIPWKVGIGKKDDVMLMCYQYHPTSGLMQILHFDWQRYYRSISNSHGVAKFTGFVNLFISFYSQINILFCGIYYCFFLSGQLGDTKTIIRPFAPKGHGSIAHSASPHGLLLISSAEVFSVCAQPSGRHQMKGLFHRSFYCFFCLFFFVSIPARSSKSMAFTEQFFDQAVGNNQYTLTN